MAWKSLADQKREPTPPRFSELCEKYEKELKQKAEQYEVFSKFFREYAKFLIGLNHELENKRSTKRASRLLDETKDQIKRVRDDMEKAMHHLP